MADDGGLSSFQRRMKAVPLAARQSIQPVLMRQAEAMAATMRQLAPKDDGDLAESIAVTGPGQSTPPYSQPGGAKVVPENAVAITAGNSDVRYPHLQEHGTTFHDPQPFFWPAFRLHRKRALAAIKRGIGKAIKEAK
ncbi:HK97-gp10 family putative phage morphogenesis protein [Szabonella alba]|uniref:HK97 gp10 family phage protein n=1 Tax=Szabonella alba TaxID=2804194 RepID=A0A8K0VEV9_9RHOB|nr:HK97-gp10 family putative phage morphogenesis protein [Szabonella alba]MBL4918973.1 HK97 gp10 family phage protein [Szabonella alba]